MLKMNQYIVDYVSKDYSHLPEGKIDLDCSLGVNPEDLPQTVFDALKNIPQDVIKHYPHNDDAQQKIAEWYRKQGIARLTKENILLGCGSLDLLYNINLLCLTREQKVLGHAPQFTAYIDHVNSIGSVFCYYTFDAAQNYKFDAGAYRSAMSADYSLFVVENPNNPTGQVIDLADIKAVAEKARELGRILLVDEAYGDYMETGNSAINLVPDYPNLAVTRTFSKAFGMAGMRMGYAAISTASEMLSPLKKVQNMFACNGIARALAMAALAGGASPIDSARLIADKKTILDIFDGSAFFRIAHTSERTPIMTLYYTRDANFDLQAFLLKHENLLTVSCASYDGLGKNAVRIMLPKHADVPLLAAKLKDAQAKLS
ncbi:MAG: histidinol-phosphate transaminase [Treponemataceae bacterium]|nr:MAG: histidinol-phosphate transaminase [Treponemataceae bacterium]